MSRLRCCGLPREYREPLHITRLLRCARNDGNSFGSFSGFSQESLSIVR